MTANTVHRGSVLVLVIGREGVEGGLPTAASEQLARTCAIRTGGRMGPPAAPQDAKEIDWWPTNGGPLRAHYN
jgi:hypothetical protein